MTRTACSLLLIAALAIPVAACSQTVDRLVAGAGDGNLQFHYAARDGACGDGRGFFRTADMNYAMNYDDGDGDALCARGPVRVVLIRDGHDVVRVETYVGPLTVDPDAGRDLGAVPADDAATYLLHLAASLDGRPARDAIVPAMLADSAIVTQQLLRLAEDPTRSREVRATAMAWAARRRDEAGGAGAAAVQHALDGIVRDADAAESLRQQALSDLANLDRGAGVPLMIAYADDADSWIARQAMNALARSGDPRARAFVRNALRRTDLPDEAMVAVIRGLGGEYATPSDFKALRDRYATLDSDQERSALISAVASAGGAANVDWLLELARSPTETASRRRQAVSELGRVDDPRVKAALKDLAASR